MNEKQISALIVQQKKTNALLEEILKELRKGDELNTMQNPNDGVPELLDNEKNIPFARVVKNGYIYTFCYGRYLERKEATPQEIYMYRDASERQNN